ncbi:MAG: glutamine-synthetase adenylyltransferase, partial [Dokdonella sp.]|nr:glutamine-synthetase adenylyltransferase [Dokdonella sp.]
VENRVQMFDDQQCHALPDDALARARIAVALGHRDAAALDAALERQRAVVAEQFAALMAVEARSDAQRTHAQWAQLWHELRDADEVDPAVLAAAGFVPAAEVAGELQALLGSVTYRNMSTRSRERLERVMPALLAAAAAQGAAVPCLLRLLRLVQAVARRSVYLALLDEQPAALRRVSTVFAASAFLAERVIAHPLLLDDLFDDRIDPDWTRREALEDELARRLAALGQADSEAEIELIQEVRQSALFGIGLAFLGAQLDAVATARALGEVASVVLDAVLRIAERDLLAAHGRLPLQAGEGSGLAIIAYGSFGGAELGFGSDLDLVFLYDGELAQGESDGPRPLDAQRYYARLVQRIVHLLGVLTRAGRLYEVDVRLRPDGSKGMLVLSLAAFEAYQRERAWTWELQALVRARAVAGDVGLSRRFGQLRAALLTAPRDGALVCAEVAAMRARWRAERDRSDAQRFDLKQGVGGLVDIEFLLQALVLTHAAAHPLLIDSGNSAQLIARLGGLGIFAADDAAALARAHERLLARAIGCTLDAQPRIVARDADIEQAATVVHALAAGVGLVAP